MDNDENGAAGNQNRQNILAEIEIPNSEAVKGIKVLSLQDDDAAQKTEELTASGYKLFKVIIKKAASQKFPTTFEMIVGIFIKR